MTFDCTANAISTDTWSTSLPCLTLPYLPLLCRQPDQRCVFFWSLSEESVAASPKIEGNSAITKQRPPKSPTSTKQTRNDRFTPCPATVRQSPVTPSVNPQNDRLGLHETQRRARPNARFFTTRCHVKRPWKPRAFPLSRKADNSDIEAFVFQVKVTQSRHEWGVARRRCAVNNERSNGHFLLEEFDFRR